MVDRMDWSKRSTKKPHCGSFIPFFSQIAKRGGCEREDSFLVFKRTRVWLVALDVRRPVLLKVLF